MKDGIKKKTKKQNKQTNKSNIFKHTSRQQLMEAIFVQGKLFSRK